MSQTETLATGVAGYAGVAGVSWTAGGASIEPRTQQADDERRTHGVKRFHCVFILSHTSATRSAASEEQRHRRR